MPASVHAQADDSSTLVRAWVDALNARDYDAALSLVDETVPEGLTAEQAEKAREALEQSVQEFRKVFVNYPRGAQVPTALYKEALALVELKQMKVARARLQYLVDNFPQSEEAPLARERLKSLGE